MKRLYPDGGLCGLWGALCRMRTFGDKQNLLLSRALYGRLMDRTFTLVRA
jgi:hypothetical protein